MVPMVACDQASAWHQCRAAQASAWERWRVLARAGRYEQARRAQVELRRLGLCPGRRLGAVERLRHVQVHKSALSVEAGR